MDAKLPPQLGAEVQCELERLGTGVFDTAGKAGLRAPQCVYAADALVQMGRRSRLQGDDNDTTGLGTTGGGDTGAGAPDQPSGGLVPEADRGSQRRLPLDSPGQSGGGLVPVPKPKVAVSVIADLSALRRGATVAGERCEIPGVGSVPVAWVTEQLGEAIVRLFIRHGQDLTTMATTARAPTEHMKAVLDIMHPTCAVTGCGARKHLQTHHTTSATGWADTHRTKLDELCRLCTHHHDLVTHHGHQLAPGPQPHTWHLHPPGDPPGGDRPGPGRPMKP